MKLKKIIPELNDVSHSTDYLASFDVMQHIAYGDSFIDDLSDKYSYRSHTEDGKRLAYIDVDISTGAIVSIVAPNLEVNDVHLYEEFSPNYTIGVSFP